MLDINFAALARYKNKCASFTLNKMQMESAAGFTMKLDRTTSIGTELVYNLMEGVSYTNFVSLA
jgi:hypothetical protein